MNAMWSEAKVKVSHRLAMHLRVDDAFACAMPTPMVSFTFDDLPKSAVTTGAGLLEAHGARGTFYVSGGLVGVGHAGLGERRCQPTWSRCIAAATRSAAIPSRTSAPATSTRRRSPTKSRATATTSARSIPRSRSRPSPIPFGYGSFARKYQLKEQFQTCRSIVPGVNAGSVDLQFLRAMPLIDRHIDRDGIDRAFDEAQTNNGWLIFYGHDVADRPSPYGCSPALLQSCARGGNAPENPGSDHGGGDCDAPALKRFVCHFGE